MRDQAATNRDEDWPEAIIHLVKPELHPGERLLWAATAQPGPPQATGNPIGQTLFALLSFGLGGGAFHLIFGPLRSKFLSVEGLLIGSGLIASVAGMIALIVAGYAVADRWATHDVFAASIHALTDRRAILWVPRKKSGAIEVHTIARGSVKSIHRLEYPDGSGSVRFDYRNPDDDYSYSFGPSGFESITDVRFVEDLARRTLIDPGGASTT